VILGSAFSSEVPAEWELEPRLVDTRFGAWTLHQVHGAGRHAFVSFRHGLPHTRLPHQINFRAQAAALAAVGCSILLVTSSVGVLDPELPLDRPILLSDLLMLDNRLPSGEVATLFHRSEPGQGHLVMQQGPFSSALSRQVDAMAGKALPRAVFGYTAGPRTKTRAEGRFWRMIGAQVNSMTVAPEVVLANELEIPTVGLAVGHKRSDPDSAAPRDVEEVAAQLRRGRAVFRGLVLRWLREVEAVPFANSLYTFGEGSR